MMNADSTSFRSNIDDQTLFLPPLGFLTRAGECAVHHMVEQSPLVASANDPHAPVFRCRIIQHHHHGDQIGVGVREEGEVLMPVERSLPFGRRLGRQLGVFQLDVIADQRADSVDDPGVLASAIKAS